MKPVFADFNAMTESGRVRLNCRGSQDDLNAAGLRPGDWAWLSDGEVLVGGRLEGDPTFPPPEPDGERSFGGHFIGEASTAIYHRLLRRERLPRARRRW